MLTVLYPVGVNPSGNMTWQCVCDCGKECIRAGSLLQMDKHKSSCGCTQFNESHGKSYTEEYALYNTAKKRAKKLKREFTIDVSDVVIPEYCPCLGVPLEKHTDYAPSLDRIDPSKGYVKGNVWVISVKANRIKNDATPAELTAVAKAVAFKTGSIH